MSHLFHEYGPDRGEIAARKNGSLVSMEDGLATAYALNMIQERGRLMVEPGDNVYAGMIVGENPLANLKVLYGSGFERLNDRTGRVERVGGIRYTIKDGIVYDAAKLRDGDAKKIAEWFARVFKDDFYIEIQNNGIGAQDRSLLRRGLEPRDRRRRVHAVARRIAPEFLARRGFETTANAAVAHHEKQPVHQQRRGHPGRAAGVEELPGARGRPRGGARRRRGGR